MNKSSKIYVAGHTGLVGSAIIKNLRAKGFTNIIGRTFEELNLTDPLLVANYFKLEQPEYVFLAAAKVGGIVANNTYRAEFIYENLMIQNNIIHQSYSHGVKKLLFLGSTCIYPKDAPQPMKEDSLLTSELEYTNEPYAIAKIAGIKMCESYNLQYGTDFLSVMPTNLYGPNDNFDLEKSHVLPALLRKIYLGKCLEENNIEQLRSDLNKRPIEGINGGNSQEEILSVLKKYGIRYSKESKQTTIDIWDSGNPKREFLWSEEMADACVYIMENVCFKDAVKISRESSLKEDSIDSIKNTHINIGTGKEISIKDLAVCIQKTIGFNGSLEFDSTKPDGTMRKLTDPSKIHALGWKHSIEIQEGIAKLYQWYLNEK